MKIYGLLLILFLSFYSVSTEAEVQSQMKEKIWEFEIMPYLFLPDVDATVSIGPFSDHVSKSVGDLLPDLNAAIMLRTEIWRKRFGFIFDGIYMNIGSQTFTSPPLNLPLLNTDVKMGLLNFLFTYRVFNHTFSDNKKYPLRLVFEPQLGLRWNILDTQFTLLDTFSNDGSTQWVDPLMGANIEFFITRGFSIVARGDVGGFGVPGGSEINWTFDTFLSYRFHKIFGLFAGYKVCEIDYKKDSTIGQKEFDVFFHGPLIGVLFFF